ncbi:hypothetical protein QJ854_gp698 [Moumouvirus goulette]|uniref:Uncharacterized protein n=1 Tax=Moumouvirus goulette TaxID=1247379 RepID=M1PB29_9VIRU|nr:hypothetical protein QJ854_gp698 [Moumouvirus goulette]AGF85084.1 hypothetical protein glt_00275 [Moumouvirus goulette]
MSSGNYQPSDWPGTDTWAKLNESQFDKVGFIEGIYDEYDRNRGPTELSFAGLYALRSPDYNNVTPSIPIAPAHHASPTVPIAPTPSITPSGQYSNISSSNMPVHHSQVPVPANQYGRFDAPTNTHQNMPVEGFTQNVNTNTTFYDNLGRRCRIVCDPVRPPNQGRPPVWGPGPQNPQQIARSLIGRTIFEAQRIYPNIRVVRSNGRDLPTTMDYRPDRINVETRGNVIIRIDGFY